MDIIWDDDDHYVVKTGNGEIGHIVYLDGIEPWFTRNLLPHGLRGDVVRTKPHRRQLDAIASRWAPMAEVSTYVEMAELIDGLEERRRRRRNRAAMAARGWSHVI